MDREPGRRRRDDEPEIRRIFARRGTVEILRCFRPDREAIEFGEFMDAAPRVARQVVSQRLLELQRADVIRRELLQHGPPTRTQYKLTSMGEDLARVATELAEIADRHREEGSSRDH